VRERGVALLVAAVAVALTTVFTMEFSTNTNVDWAAANNERDDMRAQLLARSGMNLGELIIKVQTDVMDKYKQILGDIQLADFMPMFMGAFGGEKDEVEAFGELLGVGGGDLKGLGVEIGTFSVEITTDDNKINVNCANGGADTVNSLKAKIGSLIYLDAYNNLFENAAADGWRRDRQQQVEAILDYIDTNSSKLDTRGASEDYGYQTLKDRYKEKNNYLDTVSEMKLIRGIDDRFWTLFGHQFTVYGECKENLSAIEDPALIAAIIALAAAEQEKNGPVLSDPTGVKLMMLATMVAQARSYGIYFDTLQAFVDFVKDPNGAMTDLMTTSGLGAPAPAVPVEGVALNPTALAQIARAGTRRIYRVETIATIDTLEKTIVGVWDTQFQNQNPRNPANARGTWVYWRED
jgi:general secretion pathway protein K